MIERRLTFVVPLVLVLLAAPLDVEAQEHKAGKVYRLGVLTPGGRPAPSLPVITNLLPAILRELGYVEGQNLVIERRFAEGRLDRLPPDWRESWCSVRWTYWPLSAQLRSGRRRTRRRRFRSSCCSPIAIRSNSGLWRASRGRAGTSPGC